MKKDLKELREARLAANEKLGEFYLKVANREMTAEEKMELEMLNRELNQYNEAIRIALSERV